MDTIREFILDRGFNINSSLLAALLLSSFTFFNNEIPQYTNFEKSIPSESFYDFIIIGGGSAGTVLASRLSENNNWNILLLESGGQENEITDVPLASIFFPSEFDWNYIVETNGNACLDFENCKIHGGKALGGSSVINGQMYIRGNRRDYDSWESMGNYGWGYKDVLPYFKKSEDNKKAEWNLNEYHSTGGYLTVTDLPYYTSLASIFLQAGQEKGYEIRDCNGEYQSGFMLAQTTTRRGSRCSTSKAFIQPVQMRPNLHISLHSHVTKININPFTKTAESVSFEINGERKIAKAIKEIILSAGVIASPQILMLSGVGPSDHLAEFNIPVIQNLKVGSNFHDHVSVIQFEYAVNETTLKLETILSQENIMRYSIFHDGPLTNSGFEAVGFINSKFASKTVDFPDIGIILMSFPISNSKDILLKKGLKEDIAQSFYKELGQLNTLSAWTMLLQPKSRGYIKLKSADPFEYPLVYPNYLGHPDDVKRLADGIKFTASLCSTNAFQRVNCSRFITNFNECDNFNEHTDEYWECVTKHRGMTGFHPVGSCKMGPNMTSGDVVDPELRVYGINGLRVIDASIIPTVINGNTNAPTIMIAEKGSDMIKNFWNKND